MTLTERALAGETRAEEVRMRRLRDERVVERAPREPRRKLRRGRRPRRRYDLTLPVELGTEIRLPAIPIVHPGPRALSFVLLAGSVALIVFLLSAPAFHVAEAAVAGNRILSDGQLQSIAAVDGQSIFLVDPQAVLGRLMAYPEVAAAQTAVRWPNRVELAVVERQPMAIWTDAGRPWWISADGIAYAPHGEWPGVVEVISETQVLAISEDPLALAIPAEVLQAAAVLSSLIPEANPLQFDPARGLGFEDPRGWSAYFGTGGDMVVKVRMYAALAANLTARAIQPALVSVEDAAAPYYRLER